MGRIQTDEDLKHLDESEYLIKFFKLLQYANEHQENQTRLAFAQLKETENEYNQIYNEIIESEQGIKNKQKKINKNKSELKKKDNLLMRLDCKMKMYFKKDPNILLQSKSEKIERKQTPKEDNKSEISAREYQQVIDDRDKEIESLKKAYEKVASQYKLEQQQHEQVLDNIMKKIQTQQETLVKQQQKRRPKSENRSTNVEEIEKSLSNYLDKRFIEINQSMTEKMSLAILQAHKERKEMKKHKNKSSHSKRSKEISQSIDNSIQHAEESKRSSKNKNKQAPEPNQLAVNNKEINDKKFTEINDKNTNQAKAEEKTQQKPTSMNDNKVELKPEPKISNTPTQKVEKKQQSKQLSKAQKEKSSEDYEEDFEN